MREHKYKIWNKKGNCFFYYTLKELWEVESPATKRFEDLEFLEYTGLKDKNGVEIYHKDKVKDLRVDKNNIYIIEWNKYGFYAEGLEDEMFQDILKYLEVVGNIYED